MGNMHQMNIFSIVKEIRMLITMLHCNEYNLSVFTEIGMHNILLRNIQFISL